MRFILSFFFLIRLLCFSFQIACSHEPPAIPSHLSPGLQDFTARCLQLVPENRPQARELIHHPVFAELFYWWSHTLNYTYLLTYLLIYLSIIMYKMCYFFIVKTDKSHDPVCAESNYVEKVTFMVYPCDFKLFYL